MGYNKRMGSLFALLVFRFLLFCLIHRQKEDFIRVDFNFSSTKGFIASTHLLFKNWTEAKQKKKPNSLTSSRLIYLRAINLLLPLFPPNFSMLSEKELFFSLEKELTVFFSNRASKAEAHLAVCVCVIIKLKLLTELYGSFVRKPSNMKCVIRKLLHFQ